MESLYLLVPVALVFLVIAIKALFWAVNSGQYDDLDSEGYRILYDDDKAKPKQTAVREDDRSSEAEPPSAQADKDND